MADQSIYTVGGTITPTEDKTYIYRQADYDLLDLCRKGVFAYVLTSRQTGKSSLMVRTAKTLEEEGIIPVIIDLTKIGTAKTTVETWYVSFLTFIEDRLDLDTNVDQWWEEHEHLDVTRRLTLFFEEIVLNEVAQHVVIFVDEIDTTLKLDFSDDFFAAIRSLYNARADTPEFRRISFVLIGVATPSDLIMDPVRTPFNIGQRVDLTDFTFKEARGLAQGLGLQRLHALPVLTWVLNRTKGHPYLTQRLCHEIATRNSRNGWSEATVDKIVANIFFGERSHQDDNLRFVRDRLMERGPHLGGVLATYRDILQGLDIRDEERSPIISRLKLAGAVRRDAGNILRVRNPIYEKVFDVEWVDEAELRAGVADPVALARARALAEKHKEELDAERQKTEEQKQQVEAQRIRAEEQEQQAEQARQQAEAQARQAALDRQRLQEEAQRAEEQARARAKMQRLALGLGAILVPVIILAIIVALFWRQSVSTTVAAEATATIAATTIAVAQAAEATAFAQAALAERARSAAVIAQATANAEAVSAGQAKETAQAAQATAQAAEATAQAAEVAAQARGAQDAQGRATAEAARVIAETAQATAEAAATQEAIANQTAVAAQTTAEFQITRETEARQSAQVATTREAEARQSAEAETTRQAEARQTAQAETTREAEAKKTAEAKTTQEAEARQTAQVKTTEQAQAKETAQAQVTAAAATAEAIAATATFAAIPVVGLVPDTANVDENKSDGLATFYVILNNPSNDTVTVNYATSGGTAKIGDDYTATSGVLTFAAGETSQTISVQITNDVCVETGETFNVTLSGPTNATLGASFSTVLTIIDDRDTIPDIIPTVDFNSPTYTISEDGGSATIEVSLNSQTCKEVKVEYAASDSTAQAGDDYTAIAGTLTFAPGDTSESFTVSILEDLLDEDDETVALTLSNPTNATIGSNSPATLAITDNDPLPAVDFSSSTYSVNEGDGGVIIEVRLNAPSGRVVTVDFATGGGTAQVGEDYTATNGTLTFAAGETTKSFAIPILEDLLDEPDETVILTLSNPTNATLGANNSTVLTVIDNDLLPTVDFSSSTYTVDEDSGSVIIEIRLNTPSGRAVIVDFAAGDGTAQAGDDYTTTTGTLTFAPGDTSEGFAVSILDDLFDEDDETVILTLSNPTNATTGSNGPATLIIIDDDGPTPTPTPTATPTPTTTPMFTPTPTVTPTFTPTPTPTTTPG